MSGLAKDRDKEKLLMRAVRVQYTVEHSFAHANAANIRKVMDALKAKPIDGVTYVAFMLDDMQTFIHIVVARDDEARRKLPLLPEFQEFQLALRESKPISPPSSDAWNVVGASFDI